MKGILMDINNELIISPVRDSEGKITRGLLVGDITDQCASFILQSSPGQIKEDVLLGPGLTKFIRSKESRNEIMEKIRLHLTRGGINWNEYKKRIELNINSITI